jgi:hypothetical protein
LAVENQELYESEDISKSDFPLELKPLIFKKEVMDDRDSSMKGVRDE